jgi:hypothetical protein
MLATCNDDDPSFAGEYRRRARELLIAALDELDAAGDVPDLGARLQGIIDSLETSSF